jgi:hypothetical protein
MNMRGSTLTKLSRTIGAIVIFALSIQTLPFAKAADVEASTNAPVLHTRTFKLEGAPSAFYSELLSIVGNATNVNDGKNQPQTGAGSNRGNSGPSGPSTAELQLAFAGLFKAMGVNLAPPKSFFFGDRKGTLTVHATDEDLELIEQAIKTFTNLPPEVQVTVRTYELGEEAFSDFQLKWLSKLKPNESGGRGWLAGILTEPGFKAVLKTIEARNSQDLLSKEVVATLSGRQANFSPREPISDTKTNSSPAINFGEEETPPLEFDIVPYVVTDGYTIRMSLVSTATETVGASRLTNSTAAGTNGGRPITGQLPRPHSRVSQLVVSGTVWDGQTAVLILKPPYAQEGKFLVVFVTPLVVDPSGNRKNSAESLPFADKAIPPQKAW